MSDERGPIGAHVDDLDGGPPAHHLTIAKPGSVAADRLFEARRQGLERLVACWSPEQHADLARMLDKVSHELLGEPADRHLIAS